MFCGAVFEAGAYFHTITSPAMLPVMSTHWSFGLQTVGPSLDDDWFCACLDIILFGSSMVDEMTVQVEECASISALMNWLLL